MLRTPKHIGIIPDGNRRWATAHGLNKEDGYIHGLKPGLELLRDARKHGIQELTYYGFTVDNCKRPNKQVKAFSEACIMAADILKDENALLTVIGNSKSDCFPKELLPYSERRLPPDGDTVRVNLLVNYGWEWDMKNNWASRDIPRVDLVIRWGGMCRLSGFLPLQTVYSDIFIIKDLWPDYSERHLDDALEWYSKQDVTLGG